MPLTLEGMSPSASSLLLIQSESEMQSSNILFVGTPKIRDPEVDHPGERTTYSLIELSESDLQNLCINHGVNRSGIRQRNTMVDRLRTVDLLSTTQAYKTKLCKLLGLKDWEEYRQPSTESTETKDDTQPFETVLGFLKRACPTQPLTRAPISPEEECGSCPVSLRCETLEGEVVNPRAQSTPAPSTQAWVSRSQSGAASLARSKYAHPIASTLSVSQTASAPPTVSSHPSGWVEEYDDSRFDILEEINLKLSQHTRSISLAQGAAQQCKSVVERMTQQLSLLNSNISTMVNETERLQEMIRGLGIRGKGHELGTRA